MEGFAPKILNKINLFIPIILIVSGGILLLKMLNKHGIQNVFRERKNDKEEKKLKYLSLLLATLFFAIFVKEEIWHSLQLTYIPTHSWQQGVFGGGPAAFYFGRLLEFSPLYIFSFLALLCYQPQEDNMMAVLRLSAAVILLFFIAWGNYQSRYILSCIPFLILLAVDFLAKIFNSHHRLSLLIKACLLVLIIFSLVRTSYKIGRAHV